MLIVLSVARSFWQFFCFDLARFAWTTLIKRRPDQLKGNDVVIRLQSSTTTDINSKSQTTTVSYSLGLQDK